MNLTNRPAGFLLHLLNATRQYAMRPRAYALISGLTLIGSFVSVLYYIVNIVGGISLLFLAVAGALLLGSVVARVVSPRLALGLGIGLIIGGGSVYVVLVPEHHDRVVTIRFLLDLAEYLTGISVLYFLRVDVWAIAIAPGPVFLTWYLLLRRRYDLAAVVGGSVLGFFILTGDANWMTTLVGSMSVFGVLGFGSLERDEGSWAYAKHLGDVFVLSVLVSKLVSPVFRDAGRSMEARTGGGSGNGGSTTDGTLTTTGGPITAFEHITLAPYVFFIVTADTGTYWHVDSYDRYSGHGWIRSGRPVPYGSPLPPPAGETTDVRQTFRAVIPPEIGQEGFSLQVMPTAWEPIHVVDGAEFTAVTSTGGFAPTRRLKNGDEYTVVSRVPDPAPTQLQNAGKAYPQQVQDRYLQVPESTPTRVGRKAREIVGESPTPFEAVSAIEQWLETNKKYSRKVDRPADDLTDAFLFSMERGYCIHYATAMTVLLRTLGIPARFTTGYTPGQRIAENRWVIRGFNSHAWTEVYFPNIGWVFFDPTPADSRRTVEIRRLEEARAEGLQGIDTDETVSETQSFDTTEDVLVQNGPTLTQTTVMNGATKTGTEITSVPSNQNPSIYRRNADDILSGLDRTDRVTFIAAVVGGLLGISRFRLIKRCYRVLWLRWQPTTDSPHDDVERAFERLEYLLKRRHRMRHPGETPRQYLKSLDGPIDERISRVIQLYERARYAGCISREHANEAIALVDELVNE